ncbi:MAG: glycosyltransferase family 4 protein [Treponema sp.]|nr:glycosyltransferase family 4 protein [Treponema sp.]
MKREKPLNLKPESKYFVTGMLLISLNYWRKMKIWIHKKELVLHKFFSFSQDSLYMPLPNRLKKKYNNSLFFILEVTVKRMHMKQVLGNFYHPILHKMRQSPLLHRAAINKMIKKSIANETRKPRLYVDVTNVHYKDTGTGIARVTKEISTRIVNYNQKYDVLCVYNRDFDGYFDCKTDEIVTFSKGDIMFVLDNAIFYCNKYDKLYKRLMKIGISVFFFFHDLIPIRYPETVEPKWTRRFEEFLMFLVNYTGIICNSRSTCDDLQNWILENSNVKRNQNLFIGYSLLGCDFSTCNRTVAKKIEKKEQLSFLMVATVEPKKKYDQAVKAFELLWKNEIDVKLTIVGRKGWKAEKIFNLIENSAEYGKRLFWYNTGISDDELARLYEQNDAVIMASITEGFGLSVVEAARFGKPLIIRNISPFKEIAGENAFYFEGLEEKDLASAIKKWIELYKSGDAPDSAKINLRTWDDCTKDVYELLTGEQK